MVFLTPMVREPRGCPFIIARRPPGTYKNFPRGYSGTNKMPSAAKKPCSSI